MNLSRVRALAKMSLDANWIVVGLIGLHLCATMALSRIYGFPFRPGLTWQLGFFLACYLLVGCLATIYRLRKLPANPLQDLLGEWKTWRLPERVAVAAPPLLALSLFGSSFGTLKSAIPIMHPYSWDQTFAAWDAAIHGQDAWRVIQPLVGYPIVTSGLNMVYHAWLLLFNCVLAVLCLLSPEARFRNQFLIAFVLSWTLVGNLAAALLSSVGPCFMLPMLGDPRYEDLMSYLRSASEVYPILALDVQGMLLEGAKGGVGGLGRGISAMPSMHVSISTLIALLAWRISPFWGWAGVAFVVTIMLGSVHLGYHYAIDGYLSIVMTVAIWALSGRLAGMSLPTWAPSESEAPAFDR